MKNEAKDGTSSLVTNPAPAERSHAHGDHLAHFYEDDGLLARRIATFLGEGLSSGDLVMVIATKLHEHTFERELSSAGFDIAQAHASGQLMFLDADETLRSFMRDGEPDPELFELTVGAVIAKQLRAPGRARLRAYGEMVDILWRQGQKIAAIQLEELWNDVQRRHSFTLLCAYAMGGFYKEPGDVRRVCATHRRVVADDDDAVAPEPSPESNVETRSLPPEYARRLAREMAQREEVERALREALRELRAKDDALRRSKEQLRDFVENATVGLHRVGPDGTRYPSDALMAAPLRAHGHVIDAVTASRTRPSESYTADDLQLLEQLAERAGGGIENSRLYEEMVNARTRAEQLYRFAQAVVAPDRIETVFEAALTSIETALGAERAAILTFDSNDVMRFVAWHKLSDAYRRAVEGHSPWPRDAKTPEPVLVPDVSADASLAAFVPLFQSEGIAALAFVPLVAGGRLLGKFMVYHGRPHVFAAHEVETATAIANHLATVITRFAAVTRLEDTLRANELFAGVLAHDLLNPLGAIVSAAQVLLMRRASESPPADADVKPLSRILSSGQRMARMIEQLLDFTRARSGGGIPLAPRETDLETICTQAAGELELAHPEWNIQCRAVGDSTGSWDPDRLSQVVSNLIANAGQHGSAGSAILVDLDGADAEHVNVHVHNDGAIDPAFLPHIFDPFRTKQKPRGRTRGLGLGLFIVHEIVRAHGGAVEVASSVSTGTTFSVRLPRRRSPREADERPTVR
jgi:signal transduction histidine kinase